MNLSPFHVLIFLIVLAVIAAIAAGVWVIGRIAIRRANDRREMLGLMREQARKNAGGK